MKSWVLWSHKRAREGEGEGGESKVGRPPAPAARRFRRAPSLSLARAPSWALEDEWESYGLSATESKMQDVGTSLELNKSGK